MSPTTRILSLLSLSTLVACGSVPTRKFRFDAIDASEESRPCMVVVDQDWIGAADKRQFVNVEDDDELTLELVFNRSEVQVDIAPIRVENGVPTSLPKRPADCIDLTGFTSQQRMVRLRDADKQLFIISRK